MRRRLLAHPLPPDIALIGQADIGEDGVSLDGVHRHRVAVVGGAGSDAEESRLGVDGAEPAVGARLNPGDVVADTGDLPALFLEVLRRDDHGEVRLAAGAREGGRDIGLLSGRILHAEDEHVLGHPPLVARHRGGDAQGEAFLSEQGVAAVAGAVAHDKAFLGEVGDVGVLRIAWPSDILLALGEGLADRVEALHELPGPCDLVVHGRAHAGHDPHVGHDIGAIGDLDAVLGYRGADRPHAEGDHVHGAPLHASLVEPVHLRLHDGGIVPVVSRAGIFLRLAADEGAFLDACHILRIAPNEQGVRALLGIEPDGGTGGDHQFAHRLVLGLAAIAPEDGVGLGDGGDFLDPLHNGRDGGLPAARFFSVARRVHVPIVRFLRGYDKRHQRRCVRCMERKKKKEKTG